MMAKIDVTEAVHAKLKKHCKARRMSVKDYVSNLVLRELAQVESKPRGQMMMSNSAPTMNDPWSEPPFWARK